MDKDQKLWAKKYRTELAASTASLCSTASAFPLDTIKSRMQAYNFSSVRACAMDCYTKEGMNGFYRGLLAPMFSITLVRTISFSIYQKSKYTYDAWIKNATGRSPLLHANTPNAWPSLSTFACFGAAGATSGALVTVISCPFELTKLNAQIAVLLAENAAGAKNSNGTAASAALKAKELADARKVGTIGTARMLIAKHGFLGLYSGFHLHLVRDTIGTAIYFTSYESSKQILANARGKSSTSPVPVALAGAVCGLVSWLCIYPIDSAKAIFQRNVLNLPDVQSLSVNEVQPKAESTKVNFFNRRMYRGLGVSMSRSMLINAVFFSVFEGMKKQVNWLQLDEGETED